MLLNELIEAPQLGIRALYLPEGTGQRRITWTFTTDLPDPRRYLTRGQLVLTGLVWRKTEADSERFVSVVAASGAIALIAGDGLFDGVPDDVIDACRRHNMPLLAVPAGVSFASVTAFIANTLANNRLQSLTARFVRQRDMLMAVYRGQMLDSLINGTITDLGRTMWLLSASGRQIVESVEPLTAIDLDLIAAACLTAPQNLVVVTGSHGRMFTVFTVNTVGEHRVRAWFLVVDGDHNTWDAAMVDTLRELVSVIGIYRAQREGEILGEVDLADRLIELLSADTEQPETAGYLRQAGVDPAGQITVIAARFHDRASPQDIAVSLLVDAVGHVSKPVVGRDGPDSAIAIVQTAEITTSLSAIHAALELSTRCVAGVLTVGTSSPAAVSHIGGALRSARYGLQLTDVQQRQTDGTSVRLADSRQLGSAVQLLAAVPDDLRRIYVESVLGPLLNHDGGKQGDLLATLRTFLDCAGSWVRTSELTHLHLNTVRYRIKRVEDLTGRKLHSTKDRADFYLALNLI